MKKALPIIIAVAVIIALGIIIFAGNTNNAGGKSKEAFDNSKEAFEHITTAYISTNEFSQDIYEAWFLGVNKKYNYDSEYELSDFASEMHIDLKHIQQAIANLCNRDTYSYSDRLWESLPKRYNDSYFSAWVSVISEAYKCSGSADKISEELTSAKDLMKSLSNKYSDYEHYPVLKEYFTNTLAFYDFCCNPEGSFEQVKETFNNYRNNARESFFDLNYVFNNSIGGMNEYTKTEE